MRNDTAKIGNYENKTNIHSSFFWVIFNIYLLMAGKLVNKI